MPDQSESLPAGETTGAYESIYSELKKIAAAQMAGEAIEHSWSPTVLVHELYLREGVAPLKEAANRKQFYGFAAKAMRNILVDHARARRAAKRGGDRVKIQLENYPGDDSRGDLDLEALDEALVKLEALDPARAKLIELRFIGGYSMPECADTLEISLATAERWWRATKAWLYTQIAD
jgi:RNA polymerase sigma factor (TIGR02999 family)